MSDFKEPEEVYKFFKYDDPEKGEEVVISGIADLLEIPRRIGKINNIEKFDASFFDIDFKQAHTMDPMGRMLFEHTYEAIVDAGINPKDLRGTRTGVFIGSCFSDTEKIWFYDKIRTNGFGLISYNKATLANRISHWLGISGPAHNVDTACSSSLFAMEHAYRAIRSGQCDYAIVGGSNLCIHPYVSLQFKRLGVLSQDGHCRCFDEDASGYVRSEASAVAFLQKAKNAKRIYATVIHAKTNCDGYKEQGITFPSSKIQSTLLKEFYEECGVATASIPYIEAHATGTKVGDPEEINAIDRIFTKDRKNPLKVGSIKANLGHTEPASGLCSIAKAIISMESGLIPPNINLNQLRKDVKAFSEGRIKVVTETTPLDGEYIGVNSFGFGGANAHILLKSNPKTKVNKGLPNDDLPRLVIVSGRTEEAVATILNDIDNRPIDVEFIRLLHDIHLKGTSGHLYRGYTITGFKTSDEKTREIENYSDTKKPILFVFSGIGSQWPGMGQALMRFTVFAKAIEKCDAVLKRYLEAPKFSLELPLYSEQMETDLIINILRPGNVWRSYRHQLLPPNEPKLVHHAVVNKLSDGDLSSLHWIEGTITKDYQKEDLVRIHYASLNFKDVMVTSGKIGTDVFQHDRRKLDNLIGMEYSGISISGHRVMGLKHNRCLSNLYQLEDCFSWTVPENWSLEDAATVPCIYITCAAALYINAEIKKGEKILIHAGAGGISQAAITLALHEGCEEFTTVGTPEKRKFIKETFPSIDDNHIGNSRDSSFEQMILQETDGAGVDIVLNSLVEEELLASLRCLAYRGRFLEIAKFDLDSNNPLDIDVFTKEISFHAVMLDKIMITNDEIKDEIYSRVNILLKENAIKPIVRTVFRKDQVETAFRYMAAGKHIGKVLIKVREENEPLDTPILAEPSYKCFPNKSYIIMGGLGGFGLELIDWLVLRNAQNIVITSRNGLKNGYQQMRIKRWESYGVNIKILVGLDAAKREDCEVIVKSATREGPVDGIFNLAVSLKDCICSNQTMESFEESFKGKAWATKRLDEVTRKLCPDLRHFVVFSSVSCGRGNAGQTNYGMANSVMERICEKRVKEGLPGLAIQWGAIGDIGLVADMQDNDMELVIGGTLQQKITSCLQELDRFLVQDKPIVASMVVAEKRSGSDDVNNVVDAVLKIMCIKDLKTISQETSLAELGMDSMMGVEIKQTLAREFEIYLNVEDIRSLNFAKLLEIENDRAGDIKHDEIVKKKLLDGIKILIQLFGEKISGEVIVPLETNPEEGRSEVFFVPGIEGHSTIFKLFESKIKSSATCFQLGTNYELKTVEEMANLFLPHILEKLKNRVDFTLVGYSFGSLVAIELTRHLEAKGFDGRLILIDGAPQLMKELLIQYLPSLSEEELQNN
ncbi:fatty acid synthase-like, partial [Vespula squamosa]